MSDFVTSVIRDVVQKLIGVVFAYFAVHGFNVPASTVNKVDNWVVLGTVAGLLWLWTTIVRALEERQGTSQFDRICRSLGRILMFGIGTTPSYPTAASSPQPVDTPVDEGVPTGAGMGA